jgi:hypothetical protein
VAYATATFDAPGHAADEVQRFSLGHMEHILGVAIERDAVETGT